MGYGWSITISYDNSGLLSRFAGINYRIFVNSTIIIPTSFILALAYQLRHFLVMFKSVSWHQMRFIIIEIGESNIDSGYSIEIRYDIL